jgi:hypothetical protein
MVNSSGIPQVAPKASSTLATRYSAAAFTGTPRPLQKLIYLFEG